MGYFGSCSKVRDLASSYSLRKRLFWQPQGGTGHAQQDSALHQRLADPAFDRHDCIGALRQANQSSDIEAGDGLWLAGVGKGLCRRTEIGCRCKGLLRGRAVDVQEHAADHRPTARPNALQYVMDLQVTETLDQLGECQHADNDKKNDK